MIDRRRFTDTADFYRVVIAAARSYIRTFPYIRREHFRREFTRKRYCS